MIVETLKNKAIGGEFYGVEVAVGENYVSYHVILLIHKKGSITIGESFSVNDFEVLKEKLEANIPLVVTITGSVVISKKVEDTPNYKSKLLFNSNPNDFYWFEKYVGGDIFISISRKSDVDTYLQDFRSNGFYYLKVGMGPFIGASVANLISGTIEELETGTSLLKVNQGELLDFHPLEEKDEVIYSIDDQVLSSKNLIGFSSIVDYLYPDEKIVRSIDSSEPSSEFLYKKLISKIGVIAVLTIFVLLLINFFLQSYYQGKLQEASVEFSQKQEAYNKVITLKKDKKNKEIILDKSGIHNSQFLSYYVSKLIETIPGEIKLERLDVFPIKGKLKKNQPVEFVNNQIEVKGFAKKNIFLSNWIKEIKNNKWISTVEIIEYVNQTNNNKFHLKIVVRTDV